MGYLDSDGLKRFAQNVKNKAMWNWQWTKTAPCVHFWPGEETELEPVVDFLFKEIPPAEGAKGPDNPSTIQGTSTINVGRIGKNLFLKQESRTWYSVSITSNVDGSYTFNGAFGNPSEAYFPITDCGNLSNTFPSSIKLDQTKNYIVSIELISGSISYNESSYTTNQIQIVSKTNVVTGEYLPNSPSRITMTFDPTRYIDGHFIARFRVIPGCTFNNAVFKIQLEEGTTATEFEKSLSSAEANTAIPLDSIYYGGQVNLKTGEMTVTHVKDTITTCVLLNDNVTYDGFTQSETSVAVFVNSTKLPDHDATDYTSNLLTKGSSNQSNYGLNYFKLRGSAISNKFKCSFSKAILGLTGTVEGEEAIAAVNAFLAEHPLEIAYKVATPIIVQLSPQQILSLPRLDHYVPRMNIVYTDQQSVKVGYKKIDNADSYSDEEISGTKTFASSPLVPDPDDLDSQQAAPISFTKDMMRAEIEALTSGRNTIVRDQWDNPHVMVVMPKFMLSAIDPSWPNEPHPAFIVNGVQKSEVLIGKYLASKSSANRVQTLPGQLPWANITFDNSLTACRSLGNGFGMNTNAIWAARALWLWKTMPSSHEYLGNSNYGRTHSNHMLTGTPRYAYGIPGDKTTSGRTLTGTGGILWNDNEEVDGIADLSGNVYEWCSGLRLMNGEIQIISNNDAVVPTIDLSTDSSNWKAILQNGSLVAPNTTDTLKYDGTNPDTTESWTNAGTFNVNTTIVNPNTNGCYRNYFKDTIAFSGVTIPNILKVLALYPISSNVQGGSWVCTNGERLALRGGGYATQSLIGPFNLGLDEGIRTYQTLRFGFRTAYIP